MVPCHYHQVVSRTKKLYNNNKTRCPYRKTQAHLKSYKLLEDTSENELLVQNNHKWTVKSANYKQNYANLAQSRARRDIKPPKRLDL